jgi:hypothetical protein
MVHVRPLRGALATVWVGDSGHQVEVIDLRWATSHVLEEYPSDALPRACDKTLGKGPCGSERMPLAALCTCEVNASDNSVTGNEILSSGSKPWVATRQR